ncbi:MAG: hypothetical protein AAB617_02165 [Patescibacteria group bacterium]
MNSIFYYTELARGELKFFFIVLFVLLGFEAAEYSAKRLLSGKKRNDENHFDWSRRFEKLSTWSFFVAYALLATRVMPLILAIARSADGWPKSDAWADIATYSLMTCVGLVCLLASLSTKDRITEQALGTPLLPAKRHRDDPWRTRTWIHRMP